MCVARAAITSAGPSETLINWMTSVDSTSSDYATHQDQTSTKQSQRSRLRRVIVLGIGGSRND